jgi:hypothetical protein
MATVLDTLVNGRLDKAYAEFVTEMPLVIAIKLIENIKTNSLGFLKKISNKKALEYIHSEDFDNLEVFLECVLSEFTTYTTLADVYIYTRGSTEWIHPENATKSIDILLTLEWIPDNYIILVIVTENLETVKLFKLKMLDTHYLE